MSSGRFWAVVFDTKGLSIEYAAKLYSIAKESGCTFETVMISEDINEEDISRLSAAGSTKIYHIKADIYFKGCKRSVSDILKELCVRMQPEALIIPATLFGRFLAPTLAAQLRTGVTADCTELRWDDDKRLLQSRPTFGGRWLATISTNTKPVIATVRYGVFCGEAGKAAGRIETEYYTAEKQEDFKLVELTEVSPSRIRDAKIILAGGLGLGSRKNFERLYDLAELCGAEVAASRGAVSAGYAPYARQVGQTGMTVRPDIYIAFGISGAVQHLSGMIDAERIIAVNSDSKAPIHNNSDYSVVADCNEIISRLIEKRGDINYGTDES